MQQLLSLRYVAAGGAVGALLRWGLLNLADDSMATGVVFGLNVFGSILLGLLIGLSWPRRGRSRVTLNQFLLAGTGFCGGLTTFSTYAVDVAVALDDGAVASAALTGFGTALVAVVGAGIGYRIGSRP